MNLFEDERQDNMLKHIFKSFILLWSMVISRKLNTYVFIDCAIFFVRFFLFVLSQDTSTHARP